MYLQIERVFERLTSIATKILGNPITFILAFILVIYWWSTCLASGDIHQDIGDIIFGITFLSLFLIQKSFNKYSALVHLKINELIASHEAADNAVMDTTGKTEHEIRKLSKEYIELDETETDIIDDAINEEEE
jgi:low affinity Fe/Cu permease